MFFVAENIRTLCPDICFSVSSFPYYKLSPKRYTFGGNSRNHDGVWFLPISHRRCASDYILDTAIEG